ncbi:MAG: M23 family metallopeptidase [Acidimicrobiia bacterium]|nr:M23 family metallopeptidase [Acidimicrobiia bacterium]
MVRVVALALVLVVGSGVAAAQEAEAPEAPRLIPMAELTSRAAARLAAIQDLSEMAGADWRTVARADIAHLDLFIGTLRMEADRTLRAALSREAVEGLRSLPLDALPDGITDTLGAVGLDGVETWRAEGLAPEWLEFAAVIAELQEAAAGLGPERVCPVVGDTWFTNTWGEDRPGARAHKGIDMTGSRGIPVQAIEDGVVVQANWHRQGGRQIWVRAFATGDVYYYAHLDYWEKWIWTGTRVEAGDVMGTLGSSGNADSPHLHFGWMPGSYGVDLENLQNPYPLLLEICPQNDVPEWFSW